MSNCKFLIHPVNNQTLYVTVNELVPMYYGVNDIIYGMSGNISTVLKPFSNLFVLEPNQTGFTNIEPLRAVTLLGKGLPSGMGFYKYNAITGKSTVTGDWEVQASYRYNTGDPNALYNSPVKTYKISVRPSGTFIDNPFFEVIIDSNGNQLLPMSGNNGEILVPITGGNGQPGYIESGFLESGTGCKQTFASGTLLPFTFCVTGECPSGQVCAYVDSTGITQEGGAEEPTQGGQKGDPINTLPLRIVRNDMVTLSGPDNKTINAITSGCNFYTTQYVDTRDRTENFFLGRIGNRYVRLDTLTWSGKVTGAPPNNSGSSFSFGVLRGFNVTKGIINSINANREITSYTETEGTMYYVGNGSKPAFATSMNNEIIDAFSWGNLYQRNKGGQDIPLINTPVGFLRGFFVEKNIGIDDVTALRFSWCYGQSCADPSELALGCDNGLPIGNNWAFNDSNFMGGQISFTLGELYRFDEIGGSLIENMQYNYNRAPLNYTMSGASGFAQLELITNTAPWRDWGKTLKFTSINDKFKYFYGLDWTFTRGTGPTNSGWRIFLTPTGSFTYNVNANITSANNCTLSIPCPPCDPGCPCFTGHSIVDPNISEPCPGLNNAIMPRWLCKCYGSGLDIPTFSTTSSLTPEMFFELIN